ncbi:MAG: hypothetical protein ACK491_02835, partial [Pseudanabaena sp.]
DQAIAGNRQVNIFQIVLSSTSNMDMGMVWHSIAIYALFWRKDLLLVYAIAGRFVVFVVILASWETHILR